MFLFLFLRVMESCCPLSSGRGYWRDGHLRRRGHLCWCCRPTSGDKDGRTTTTRTQRRLRCRRQDDDGDARQRGVAVTARETLAFSRNVCGASAAPMMVTQLRNNDACIAGAAPTTATLRRLNHSCVSGAANNGDATATQRRRNRDACVASAARMTPKQ